MFCPFLVVPALLSVAEPARADTVASVALMPNAISGTSAEWDGSNAYVFGGSESGSGIYYDTIVRFSPSTNAVTTMGAKLPYGRDNAAVVWTGTYAYVFGGSDGVTGAENQILRYHPGSDSLTTMGATIPNGRERAAAIWDGTYAYVFGGQTASGSAGTNTILRYHPASDSVTTLAATLPSGRYGMSAIWDGSSAHLFGGNGCGSTYGSCSSIVKFTPSSGSVTTLSAALPTARTSTAAAWDGSNAYVFGGYDAGGTLNEIVRFNPSTQTVTRMANAIYGSLMSTVWNGQDFNTFGGFRGTSFRDIYRYRLTPGAPQSVSATPGVCVGEVKLDWAAPVTNSYTVAPTQYKVYRGTTAGSETVVATLGDIRTHTSTGLTQGTTYYLRVSAVNSVGEGTLSSRVSATPACQPGAPTGLVVATGPGAGVLTLSWNAPASNGGSAITGYKMYRGTASGGETLVQSLGSVVTYQDSGLATEQTYFYKVSAVNAVGEGSQSAEASQTTWALPGAPRSPAASTGPGVGQISVTWQAPATNGGTSVTGYKVYRGASSGSLSLHAALGTTNSFEDAGLEAGARFYYAVAAITAAGEGTRSAEVSAVAPASPTAPLQPTAAAGPSTGEIRISWQAPADDGGLPVTGYRLYRGATPGSETLLVTLGNVLAYTNSGLGNGASYSYAVTAVNAVGEGAKSSSVTAATFDRPGAPRSLTASAGPGAGEITLAWQAPASDGGTAITAYLVLRGTAPGQEQQIASVSATTTTFRDTNVAEGTTRFYKMVAQNMVGASPSSAGASATTFARPPSPASPATQTGPGTGQISVSWQSPSTDGGTPVTRYRVYAGEAAGSETFLGETTATSFTHSGLPKGAVRYYRIAAVNLVGEGAKTGSVEGRAPREPDAPRLLVASQGASPGGIVRVEWQPPAYDGGLPVTRYLLYRTTVSGGYSVRVSVGSATSYTETDLIPGVRYYYRVAAENVVGEGARSAESHARASIAPNSFDGDGDGVPALVEARICGTGVLRDNLDILGEDEIGRCSGSNDYRWDWADRDEDLVADETEFLACGLEDVNSPDDGICVGNDYGPPPFTTQELVSRFLFGTTSAPARGGPTIE